MCSLHKMKIIIVFCILSIWIFKIKRVTCRDLDFHSKLDKYLKKQSDDIINDFQKHSVSKRDADDIEISAMKRIPLDINKTKHKPILFSLNGDVYLIQSLEVFKIDNITFNLNTVGRFSRIGNNEYVLFVRVAQTEGNVILFVRTQFGNTYVYKLTNTNISFVHSLYLPYFKDCKFFIQDRSLYLAVISNEGDHLSDLMVYKWLGTHLDETSTKSIRSAIEIDTFPTATGAEVLVILHKSTKMTHIEVYEFYNDNLKKLQYLPINKNSTHLEVFNKNNEEYLTIYDTSGNNSVYFWEVSHLRKSFTFTTTGHSIHSEILKINSRTAMISAQLEKLQIYYIQPGKLIPVAEATYNSTNLNISSIHNTGSSGNITSFIVSQREDDSIDIHVMSLKIKSGGTDMDSEEIDVVRKCFGSLEERVYNMQFKLKETELVGIKPSHEVDELVSESHTKEADMDDVIKKIRETLKQQQDVIDHYNSSDGKNLVINGSVTFTGSVVTEKLQAKELSFKKLNGKKWVPQEWLKYKEPQTISGPVKIENITTLNLYTSADDDLFKDMLLKDGDQVISAPVKVRSIKTNNGISTNEMDTGITGDTGKILQIKSVEQLPIPQGNIHIENLFVEEIDGVNWDEFVKSVFVVGETTHIDGPLSITTLKTGNLTIKTLNGIDVDKFMTTSTDQVIKSNIGFDAIFTKNINVNTTNGIKLADEVVTFEENATVTGPVTLDQLNVVNTLEVVGKVNGTFFKNGNSHFLETKESEQLQRYTGKVRIKGNLHLRNLKTLPRAKLLVSGNEINPNISDVYWTKSTQQEIPVNVTFLKGLTIPHLLTENLNGIQFNRYMTDDNNQEYETTYIFDNVEVRGNVSFSGLDADHKPDLTRIDQEAVKTSGVFNIRGRKTYQKELITKNLIAEKLAGIDTSNALSTKTSNVTVKGRKIFENLTVTGNLTFTNKNKVNHINGIEIGDLLDDIIYIDRPENITMLDFNEIKATNLHVTMLNEIPTDHYHKILESIKTDGRINKLVIKSNVTLDILKNVSTINGLKFKDLEEKMMKIGKHGLKVDVKFNGKIKVNNLMTAFINDINLRKLFSRILSKKENQNITAPWSFSNIKTENLDTPSINDYDVENLIDVSSELAQLMYSPSGTEFMDLVTAGSIEAPDMKPCSLDDIVEYINNPPTQEWKQIHVEGNVTVLEADSLVNRVLEKTAKRDQVNIIQAPVTFASDIIAKNINTSVNVNNINITEIVNDAVLSESEETQRISGQKWFKSVRATSAVVLQNADILFVNGEDVRKLDADLVNKYSVDNTTISGRKTFFGGLKTKNLNVKVLGDVQPKDIVLVDSKKPIPSAIFEYVEIESNLNVKSINNISLQKVLENRILVNGPMPQRTAAIVYFDNISIQNVTASTINKVKVDDVVFDVGDQNIMSKKNFVKDIEVFGNVTTDIINGVNISQAYENAVLSNTDIVVNGSIVLKKPSHISGALQTEAINSCPVELIKDVLRKGTTELAAKEIQDIKSRIAGNIARTLPIAQALESEFMYLEKSKNLQIQVPNSMDTTIMKAKDYVLLHITGEEPGARCSLADSCRCPVHQTLEISPQRTVTDLPTKGVMRVFSYDDDTMIIHFISNSVSYNSTCRTDESKLFNEYSAMSWNTYTTSTTTAGFHQHEDIFLGYIRKVEFFSLHGKTYAIVGTFYDPMLDSYDLNCIVFKFEGAKTKATEIQRIPTKGVIEVYVFHTAQGVTLILGNSKDSDLYHEEGETQILRFDENTEKFLTLRSLPFGFIQATGVVFGADSLIVLAHKTIPVQILRYYPEYDNYYFYQNFNEIGAPVIGISSFYTGGFGISDAYLSVVTSDSDIYIYSFKFIVGWNLEIKMRIEGATELVPFELNGESLLFVSSTRNSTILTVVRNGPN